MMIKPVVLMITERYFTPKHPTMYMIQLEDMVLATTVKKRANNVLNWLGQNNYTNYSDMKFSDKRRLIASGMM